MTISKKRVPKGAVLSMVPRQRNPFELIEEQVAADSAIVDIDFSKITRLKGEVANGDNTDPVVYDASTELQMRRLIAHFGFERLPFTWSELNSLIEYCESLLQAAGRGIPVELVAGWQRAARKVNFEERPWVIPAIDAYLAGDIKKLQKIHQRDCTVEKLAAAWVEYPTEESIY